MTIEKSDFNEDFFEKRKLAFHGLIHSNFAVEPDLCVDSVIFVVNKKNRSI